MLRPNPSAAAAAAAIGCLPHRPPLRTLSVCDGPPLQIAFSHDRDRDARLRRRFSAAMGPWVGRLRHLSGRLPLEPPAFDQQQRPDLPTEAWMLDSEGQEPGLERISTGTVNCGPPPAPHQALDVARAICWLGRGGFGPLAEFWKRMAAMARAWNANSGGCAPWPESGHGRGCCCGRGGACLVPPTPFCPVPRNWNLLV